MSKVIKIFYILGLWIIVLCNFFFIILFLINIWCYYVNDRKLKRVIFNDIFWVVRVGDGGLGFVIRGL